MINYYQSFGRKLAIQYSLGGRIDLSAMEVVDIEDGNSNSSYTFFSSRKLNSWSQVSAGVGMQYQLKRFVFQLQPMVNYNFYKYESIQNGLNFQLRTGVLFDLRN